MKNRWVGIAIVTLSLVLLGGLFTACTATSPLVGKWHDAKQNSYIEFSWDGKVILDDGMNIITGTYEIVGDDYVKVRLEGFAGAWIAFFGADTWKFEVSGDTLILQQGGKSATLKRVR